MPGKPGNWELVDLVGGLKPFQYIIISVSWEVVIPKMNTRESEVWLVPIGLPFRNCWLTVGNYLQNPEG